MEYYHLPPYPPHQQGNLRLREIQKLIQDPQLNGILLGLPSVSQLKGLLWEGGQRALLPTLKSSRLRSSQPPRHPCPRRPVPPGKWRVDPTLRSSKGLPFTCPIGTCPRGARFTALGFMVTAVSPVPRVVTFLPLHAWRLGVSFTKTVAVLSGWLFPRLPELLQLPEFLLAMQPPKGRCGVAAGGEHAPGVVLGCSGQREECHRTDCQL